jgi:hypothetical protein
LGFGYAAASVTEGYVCAVLVDFAVKNRVGASIELDCPILGLCVCVVHVFLSCWVEVDVTAQIQQ